MDRNIVFGRDDSAEIDVIKEGVGLMTEVM